MTKKYKLIVSATMATAVFAFIAVFAAIKTEAVRELLNFSEDPDMPAFLEQALDGMSKEEFMERRANQIAMYRGLSDGDLAGKIATRANAINEMQKQEEALAAKAAAAPDKFAPLVATWTPLGPEPIPNGQTGSLVTAVSGRTTAIAIHPTNPDLVYVGTAQGGLYRTSDGGATWTPLLDNAASLAIGAVAIAPSQPDTVYVGTGEPNFSSDSYYGVGVYRIDNASSATPTISGPFGGTQFNGRGIAEIIVHPTNPSMIWVASTSAAAALQGGAAPPTTGNRGIYRADNATSASPTFVQMPFPFANQNLSVRDIAIDPLNPDLLVSSVVANGGGVVVYNNATVSPATSAVGVQRTTWSSSSTSELTGEIAIQHSVGVANPTIYVATGNLGGRVLRSTDGGVTFPQQIDNNFCTPQCFYDVAVAVDPNNADRLYLAGAPGDGTSNGLTFGFSINGGTVFTSSSLGVHSDSHAIAVAPSNTNRVYLGTDGGIYRSDTQGLTWTSISNAGYRATQFMSLDTHPSDPNITIGGTQDNGTNRFKADATWTRTDYGDGGYAVIDQSSADLINFNQYHTYFNASNLTAYAYSSSSTAFENWTLRGCTTSGGSGNGIFCTATVNFYAPLERGPGTPNSIYYGSDRLYRSVDTGANNTAVSQTFTSPLSAIGVSPQNDNVRIIGQNNGGLFGTTTGANPLVDLDPTNAVPNAYVTRVIVDPTNSDTAYVTLALFNTPQIYKVTNLSTTPTWTAISGAATGLPLIPVNAFAVENNVLYAGTDIGVYVSKNGGTNWTPLGTGLPKVAIFDMAFAGSGSGRVLRIATHGKGLYQIPALQPILSISGTVNYGTDSSKKVQNVLLTVTGESSDTKMTDNVGGYAVNNLFTSGDYTVTATKTGDENEITSFDATLVLRCVAASTNCTLTANQQLAADANGSGGLTSFDATLILRYVAAGGSTATTGDVGKWKFSPASRSYTNLSSNANAQDYNAFLIGEVNGSWTPPGSTATEIDQSIRREIKAAF